MQISSRYNPQEVEEKIYQFWLETNCFFASISDCKSSFCIVMPPPNITGILHMGHALNNTIQDVLIRFKRMQGYQVLWMPGTDHAGIATQNVVERALLKEGKRKEDIGREAFLQRLWQWYKEYGSTIINQLKKLGASCDWSRARFTMDTLYSEAVNKVFVHLYKKGLIYRGNYIINWCPRCKTALADEEAPRKEIDGWLYYIRYPVKKEKIDSRIPDYIVVATTRPETMLADTAVAVNPLDNRYKWLKEVTVILPIMKRELKVIEDELVDPEFGTGIVKVTPAHDPVDFILAKKHNLEFINIMNEDATLNQNAKDFVGLDRFKAREKILKVLQENNLLEKKEAYKINVGHCYRCNTIVEPRLSLQWFVKMKPLAQPAIRVVEEGQIRFYPEHYKKVYLNWMQNIQDWCISRQLWWGHRIPVWYCDNCREKVADDEINSENQIGIIVSEKKPTRCQKCGNENLRQDEDVLDTWFSSWLWPFATFGWPFTKTTAKNEQIENEFILDTDEKIEKAKQELNYFYPTTVLVTASEILFFWVARMIMAGLEFMGKIPFKDVLIHGTVRDERGQKMSKSLGNIIDPIEIINKIGADSLRFSLMMLASSGADVYLSDEKFLVGRNFCNKIWNASRFILMKLEEFNLKPQDLEIKNLDKIDIWLIKNLNSTIISVTKDLENYRINEATKSIYEFFWHKFCDWYIEIIKDNFTLPKAKTALYALITSLKLLHPIIPFITEHIYQKLRNNFDLKLEETLIKSKWPQCLQIEDLDTKEVESIIEFIYQVRNVKFELGIANKPVKLRLKTNQQNILICKENIDWIKRLAKLEEITFTSHLDRVLFSSDFGSFDFDIDRIDIDRFVVSLEKKIAELEKSLCIINQRLQDQEFLEKAKVETIAEEKLKYQQLLEQKSRLLQLKDAFK